MGYEIIKNVKFTKDEISFDWASNNVFPRTFSHEVMANTTENLAMMRRYLVGRIWQPQGKGRRLFKRFGITHYYDGLPVNK